MVVFAAVVVTLAVLWILDLKFWGNRCTLFVKTFNTELKRER